MIRLASAGGNALYNEAGMAFRPYRQQDAWGIVWKLIYIRDIFHTGYGFGIFFWRDAPVVVFVGMELFFKALPIVSLLTGTPRTTFASVCNKRSVQRECPSGAGVQAISIICASAHPSSLRIALSELTLRFKVIMPSIPLSEKSLTVLVTVAMQTQFVLADCSCVRTLPCASSRSIIIRYLLRTVLEICFFTHNRFQLF